MSEFFRQYRRLFLEENLSAGSLAEHRTRLEQLFRPVKHRHHTVADLSNPEELGYNRRRLVPLSEYSNELEQVPLS